MKQHTIPFTLLYAWSDEFDSNDIDKVNPNKLSRRNAKVRVADISSAQYTNIKYNEIEIDLANDVSTEVDQYEGDVEASFAVQESKIGILRSKIYKGKEITKETIRPVTSYFLKKAALLLDGDLKNSNASHEAVAIMSGMIHTVHEIIEAADKADIKVKVIRNQTGIPFITTTSLSFFSPNKDGTLDLMFPLTPDILIGIRVFNEFNEKFEINQFTWSNDLHMKNVQSINASNASNASIKSQLIYPFDYEGDDLFGGVNPQEGFSMIPMKRAKDFIKFKK